MKPPEIVNATQADLDELLAKAKPSFSPEQYLLLERVFGTFVYVMQSLQNAKTSIKRFQRMLFGHRTEHKRNVLERGAAAAHADVQDDAAPVAELSVGVLTPVGASKPACKPTPSSRPPPPGHGRNAAQAYSGAPIVQCDHPELASGERCPQCGKGRIYDSPPRAIVKVVGQPPLGATVYKLQRLRCRLCDAVFTAPLPAAVAALPKYDSSCAAMIALLRYGSGMPHFRLEGLQASLYVPLPDATQWEIIDKAVPAPRAVFQELIVQAAQAPLLHCDDTPMKVLSLMAERKRAEADGVKPAAKAINTSGIVAVVDDNARQHKVVLFFTGHAHAGKNMQRVLAQRARELAPAMQMCDALAANLAGEFDTVLANCLTHGRRQVADVAEQFPEAARHVIEALAKVYQHDAKCRQQQLSPEQRLWSHQQHSQPVMDELHRWMTEQFDKRSVEPNCGLGKALRYLLEHWEPLTLFLRRVGAPLDNNLCERALKRAILHRKGSLFYKTVKGAEVGDIYMSLIHTCRLCDVNPFEYLQALQRHAQQVIRDAARWLPWNYREQLAGAP
jgi:transposase